MKAVAWLMVKALAFTSEEGSRQIVFGAVSGREDENKMRGAYINLSKVTEPSDFVISEEGGKVQERIWVSCFLGCEIFYLLMLFGRMRQWRF